jgi:hypothetical protein
VTGCRPCRTRSRTWGAFLLEGRAEVGVSVGAVSSLR